MQSTVRVLHFAWIPTFDTIIRDLVTSATSGTTSIVDIPCQNRTAYETMTVSVV